MSKQTPVLFDHALNIAVEKTKDIGTALGDEIVLVRDLRGRIRVLLPGDLKDYSGDKKTQLDKFGKELSEALGAYGFSPDRGVLFAGDLMQSDEIFSSTDRRLTSEDGDLKIWLLDRQIIGNDWMRAPLQRRTKNRRVTFFGIKGGVGRSTALAIWSWRLAKQGKKVLILDLDLDLESPGISSTLLPSEYQPDYGIVDWFVEDGVGQADIVENAMIASSPLATDLRGEVRIVPAFGRDTGDYLPKLARCYAEFSGSASISWAERLQRMVEQSEEAPHYPLPVFWNRALQDGPMRNAAGIDEQITEAAMGKFMTEAETLVFSGEETA